MNRNVSTYLHLLRILAATGVVLGHLKAFGFPHMSPILAGHAQAGVAAFFVLSGFVIRHVTTSREATLGSYTKARLTRLYSVVPLALLFTILIDEIGQYFNQGYYLSFNHFNRDTNSLDFIQNLFFTSEIWFQHKVVGSNEPMWSLAFEAWYYFIFAFLSFSRGFLRFLFVIILALIAGPKIMLYFPLWLSGVATYDFIRGELCTKIGPKAGAIMLMVSALLYASIKILVPGVPNAYHWQSVGQALTSAAWFYAVGIATVINLIGFAAAVPATRTIWPKRLEQGIAWLAGGTFTLYLVHQPVMVFAAAIGPTLFGTSAGPYFTLALAFCIPYALAELGERRKRLYDAFFNRSVDCITKARRAGPRGFEE